jgi:hypothetical protein
VNGLVKKQKALSSCCIHLIDTYLLVDNTVHHAADAQSNDHGHHANHGDRIERGMKNQLLQQGDNIGLVGWEFGIRFLTASRTYV